MNYDDVEVWADTMIMKIMMWLEFDQIEWFLNYDVA